MSNTQTRESPHYASPFDARFRAGSDSSAGPSGGRHRASHVEVIELELAQIQARLDTLRQRMRSVFRTRTMVGLGISAGVLITLAVSSLSFFMRGGSGLGMLLCGFFIAGVPLTIAAAVRAGRPWWQFSHEAALLRQREKELHAQLGPVVVAAEEADRSAPPESGSHARYRTGRGARYDMPDEVSALGFVPEGAADTRTSRAPDPEPLPLAEYSALSSSSHVLARVVQDTLRRSAAEASRVTEREDVASKSDHSVNASAGGLIAASHPRKLLSRGANTKPSWWSPTGLNERAIKHLTPAAPEPRPIGNWGLLFVVGGLLMLFAVGIIAGVVTAG
ncbi:MAG TPA: hypothetical protein VHU91_09855 [Mycobacteriales bacterium]|nr:hypothetical protein [Mycobacteriales bacterium]